MLGLSLPGRKFRWVPHWAGKSRHIPAFLPEKYGRSCILPVIEVVWEGFLGDLVLFRPASAHGELGLGWSPGGMEKRGGGRLADVGEDLGDRLEIVENRS